MAHSKVKRRALAFAIGCGLAAALVPLLPRVPPTTPGVTLVTVDLEGAREESRALREAADEAAGSDPSKPWLAWRYHVPESVALKLMSQLADPKNQYDEWCGFIFKPGFRIAARWPEHPDGKYERRANSLGIWRDGELMAHKPALRVLVTGDSHVDGVCNTLETYPMLLEASLESTRGKGEVEVINAAHGSYALFNYFGTLERFLALDLQPDVFVMTYFGGNDFVETQLRTDFYERVRSTPEPAARARDRAQGKLRASAPPRMVSTYGQCLNSVSFFHSSPARLEAALRVTCKITEEMRERCLETGVQLLVVLLPSPSELPEQANWGKIQRGLEWAELGQEDLERLTTLREGYVRYLRSAGIAVLDLYPPFSRHEGLLYWNSDLHLNLDGHALAATEVEKKLLSMLNH